MYCKMHGKQTVGYRCLEREFLGTINAVVSAGNLLKVSKKAK
jgi:hypothetical protein